MRRKQSIIALDVGSSLIKAVVGKLEKDKLRVTSGVCYPSAGIKSGVVVGIDDASRAIDNLLRKLEEISSEEIEQVYLTIKGQHLESINNHGAIAISRTDKEITFEDVQRVIESAKAIMLSSDREIIHIIPQEFMVDGQKGIYNPLGMEGTNLGVDVHIITGATTFCNNLIKCVSKEGVEVRGIVSSIIAISSVVAREEEKELGCGIIDFGGQIIDFSIYKDKALRFTKSIKGGSDLITSDLAYIFKIPLSEAQRVKQEYSKTEEIEVNCLNGRDKKTISSSEIKEVVQARIEELMGMVNEIFEEERWKELIPAGIIITSGGALLADIEKISENVFNLPVRVGRAINIEGEEEIISQPIYSAALGLLKIYQKPSFICMDRFAKNKKRKLAIRSWFEKNF